MRIFPLTSGFTKNFLNPFQFYCKFSFLTSGSISFQQVSFKKFCLFFFFLAWVLTASTGSPPESPSTSFTSLCPSAPSLWSPLPNRNTTTRSSKRFPVPTKLIKTSCVRKTDRVFPGKWSWLRTRWAPSWRTTPWQGTPTRGNMRITPMMTSRPVQVRPEVKVWIWKWKWIGFLQVFKPEMDVFFFLICSSWSGRGPFAGLLWSPELRPEEVQLQHEWGTWN